MCAYACVCVYNAHLNICTHFKTISIQGVLAFIYKINFLRLIKDIYILLDYLNKQFGIYLKQQAIVLNSLWLTQLLKLPALLL